jgi:hypothetical protein
MYLHEVMNKKPKGISVNKIGGSRSVNRNVSSTIVGPKYMARGMSVENK